MHSYGTLHAIPLAQFHAAYLFAPYAQTRLPDSRRCRGVNLKGCLPVLNRAPEPRAALFTSPTLNACTPMLRLL